MGLLKVPRTWAEFYVEGCLLFVAAFLGAVASCAITEGCKLKSPQEMIFFMVLIAAGAFLLLYMIIRIGFLISKSRKKKK